MRNARSTHRRSSSFRPGPTGWVATRFSETHRTSADAFELSLKFQGAPHPETFIVDARGAFARIKESSNPGEYVLNVVARDVFESVAVVTVENRVLPRVVAEPQVNHGRNVSWTPTWAFRPGRDIDQLADTLKFVHEKLPAGTRIKAGGSRHSWSPAASTDGVYIHPQGMRFHDLTPANNPNEALKSSLSPVEKKHLVRFGSGTTVREANQALWSQGLAFANLGGYDGQTMGGLFPTGTQGSVLNAGPLADQVRSMDLVTPSGEKVRLEPSDGPTDPAAFRKTHPDFRLIQDDTTFRAAQINMGTFGVVHSYLVDTVDAFYLNETRTLTTGAQLVKTLENENIYNLMQNDQHPPQPTARTVPGHPMPAHHLEFWWNPTTDTVLTTSRHPVTPEVTAQLKSNEPRGFERPTRDLLRIIDADNDFSRPKVSRILSDVLTDVVATVGNVVRKIDSNTQIALLDASLKGLVDSNYVQRSYNVYNIGDGANQLPAQSATISVPLEGDKYLRAMKIIQATSRELARTHQGFQTGPVSLRFVKGSSALLSHQKDVCNFELIFAGNSDADQKNARLVVDAYATALRRELGDDVLFHLGQIAPANPTPFRRAYSRFGEFERVRKQFDPGGVMLNAWQEQLFS